MTAINITTRAAIKGYLEGFIDGLVDEYKGRKILKPKDGTELFFEIKGPKPNKGQCLEVTQRLLRFQLLSGKNRP
jgi:hypothetical protein